MKKSATTEDLKLAISEHLEQTREHVARLEQVFETINRTPREKMRSHGRSYETRRIDRGRNRG